MVLTVHERKIYLSCHALVTRTARASEPECDCSNLSAASQASSHTMRRSQTYISFKKLFKNKVTIWIRLWLSEKVITDEMRTHTHKNQRHTLVLRSRQSFNAELTLNHSATVAVLKRE